MRDCWHNPPSFFDSISVVPFHSCLSEGLSFSFNINGFCDEGEVVFYDRGERKMTGGEFTLGYRNALCLRKQT